MPEEKPNFNINFNKSIFCFYLVLLPCSAMFNLIFFYLQYNYFTDKVKVDIGVVHDNFHSVGNTFF